MSLKLGVDVRLALAGKHWVRWTAVFAVCTAALAVCAALVLADGSDAEAYSASEPAVANGYRLVKASISDCTASSEESSEINTSRELLTALSFVQGNPFYLNVRTALTSSLQVPPPCDNRVEKCEWSYDEAGRVKTATLYKSTKELSRILLSYDSHGAISKHVGWTYVDDGSGKVVREDFEAATVVEKLSSSAYGANKTTVVNVDGGNDTVLYTYDKDRNLTSVVSSGAHSWSIQVMYSTTFKYPKQVLFDAGEGDPAVVLLPVYDAESKLTSLSVGTLDRENVVSSGLEYEIQYSKGRVSKVNIFEDDAQMEYWNFSYDDAGNLASVRAYCKGGIQLYNVSFAYQKV